MGSELMYRNFDVFYQENYGKVYGYIYKRINHKEDAEDLASDVFCACFRNFDKFDPQKSSITTWLYVITNNRLKNYYRDRKISLSLDDEEIPEAFFADERDDITNSVLLEDYRNMLADAISSLSEKHQLIVILSYFGDKKSDDIAQIMNMTPGNVRVTLSRALDKISEYLVNHGWDGEI